MDCNIGKMKKTMSTTHVHKNDYEKQDAESLRIRAIVNSIFKKSFTINGNDRYKLPNPETMFTESPWKIEELQKLKTDLNTTKSKLNHYNFADWHQHTTYRNKAKDVEYSVRRKFDPEFLTQAWCKFHEIISKYPLVPKENIFLDQNKFLSLHLCEAPGAFITCLNHWLKTNVPTVHWDWLAMTYNPYYEGNSSSKMISDDRFIIYTLKNWFFGKDNTGNLMTIENMDALIKKAKSKGKVNLVTADGSVNCMNNPGEQEEFVVDLQFCEVVTAIHVLERGGNFLLKIFTTFEYQSVCLIYFLSCIFQKIQFYKPVTSKEGNSEVYTICLGFKGLDFVSPYLPLLRKEYGKICNSAMFRKNDIPESFVRQIISSAQIFKNHQCEVIENNIATYPSKNQDPAANYETKLIAKLVAEKFFTEFPLQSLHMDLQIVGNLILKICKNINYWVQPPEDSLNERQKKQILEPVHRLLMYMPQLQSLESDSTPLIFKPSKRYVDTYINVGSSYQRIQSSKFCAVTISEIFNLFYQIVNLEENKQLCLPSKESVSEYEKKNQHLWNNTYKIRYFDYNKTCDNNQTISCVKQALINLQIGDNLVFFGFLLLTQFNVGLIYLLSYTFDRVEFGTNEEIGCYVTFKSFNNKESILQMIEQVYETAVIAAASNSVVLSVASVTDIYNSDLYSQVVKLNNWIAKYCVKCIASIYGEKQEDSSHIRAD